MTRVSQALPDARRVIIAVNPKAGAKSRRPLVDKLAELLNGRGLIADIVTSREEIAERTLCHQAAGELRALVCAGGDGTVAFAANATPDGTPLAILPLGTENLLAKYFGIRANPEAVADLIDQGWMCRLDAGRAGSRLFTLMAGFGFDAEVVRRLHEHRTGHIRHLSYVKPIWSAIRTYQYPELRVHCEGVAGGGPDDEAGEFEQPIRARWVFVANLPRYAGNLSIAPRADATDGLLDVCTFKKGSLWKALQYVTAILLHRHLRWRSDVRCVRAARIRVEAEEPVSYQLDGDYGGPLPLELEAVQDRLQMLVPRPWLERSGLALPCS